MIERIVEDHVVVETNSEGEEQTPEENDRQAYGEEKERQRRERDSGEKRSGGNGLTFSHG
jgi:hypothetical protein